MSTPPFMQLYVSDYLGDTRGLTTEQHGAYLLLLMTAWNSGGLLPNDPKKLARFTGCTALRWAKIAPDVLVYFEADGDHLVSPRLVLELKKASEKSIKRAVSGSLGGQAKSLKTKKLEVAIAKTLPKHSPEPEPELISEANASSGGSLRAPPVSQASIDEIWEETPRIARDRSSRADVGKALRAAAGRGYPPAVIRPALRRYYASDQANNDDRRAAKGLHRMIECDRWRDWLDGPMLQVVRTPTEQAEYETAMAAYVDRQARAQGLADVQA